MESMTKQRIYTKPFSKAVDHYVRMSALTNKELGLAVGYKDDQMIQAIRSERSNGEETKRRKIAEYFGFTLDQFIKEGEDLIRKQNSGSMSGTAPAPAIQAQGSNVTHLNQLHWKVVEKFQQKDKALQINQELVDLEAMDPAELNGILQYIETRKEIVAKKQEAERKKRDAGGDEGE